MRIQDTVDMPTILFADPHIIGETIGGAEVQLWMLAKGFSEAGWEVHYVTDADIEKQTSYAVKIGAITDAAKPLRVVY